MGASVGPASFRWSPRGEVAQGSLPGSARPQGSQSPQAFSGFLRNRQYVETRCHFKLKTCGFVAETAVFTLSCNSEAALD